MSYRVETHENCSCCQGEVEVDCCPNPLPETLYATFGGAMAAVGTIPIVWNGFSWEGTSEGCGGVTFTMNCMGTTFQPNVVGGTTFTTTPVEATECDPFECSFSDDSTGDCAGAATITVSE